MRWLSLIFWIALCFAVAGASGRWTTAEIPTWYRTLARPAIAPPNWVFGPVWTLLYALMAVAAWRIWLTEPSPLRTAALTAFVFQLALNWHRIGGAFAEVLVLWLGIGVTTLLFARLDPAAAWMMAPYWAWVSFASVLNAAYWRLN
jgi:tryptophan-rich sensory protein